MALVCFEKNYGNFLKNSNLLQYALAKNVLAELPSNIIIGPFFVVTEGVRQNLAKKHKQLGEAILELLVQKLRNQGDEACNLCKNISRRLGERNRCKIILIGILCFLVRISFSTKSGH